MTTNALHPTLSPIHRTFVLLTTIAAGLTGVGPTHASLMTEIAGTLQLESGTDDLGLVGAQFKFTTELPAPLKWRAWAREFPFKVASSNSVVITGSTLADGTYTNREGAVTWYSLFIEECECHQFTIGGLEVRATG